MHWDSPENNAAYVDSWIKTLREQPKFIVTIMSDVNKASRMILEEIDKQKIALGEKALLEGNLDGIDEQIKNDKQLEEMKQQKEQNVETPDNSKEKSLSSAEAYFSSLLTRKVSIQFSPLKASPSLELIFRTMRCWEAGLTM